MDNDFLQYRLALVERQIVDAELHLTLRRDVLNRLEVEGLGASDTADDVRDKLRAHTAEQKQIQAQLRRHAFGAAFGRRGRAPLAGQDDAA
jgi:hypothetical protein